MRIAEIINGEMVYRDMTEAEEAEYIRQQAEHESEERQSPPSDFERIEAQTIYTAMMTDTLIEE